MPIRSSRLTFPVLILSSVLLCTPATAQMEDVQIKTTPFRNGIYMLEGSGGNIGVCSGDDSTFIIDDQYAPLTQKILSAITSISDQPVEFILNTHWHGDHTGGNENLGEAGALIVAHKRPTACLATHPGGQNPGAGAAGKAAGRFRRNLGRGLHEPC